jgi:hypothetical protein
MLTTVEVGISLTEVSGILTGKLVIWDVCAKYILHASNTDQCDACETIYQSPRMSNRWDILCLCFDGGSINLTTDPELNWQSAELSLNIPQFKTQSYYPSHARHLCSTIPSHLYPCQRCNIIIIIMDECIHPWWYKQPQETQGHISKNED